MIIDSVSSNDDLSAYLIIDEFQNYATASYNDLLKGKGKSQNDYKGNLYTISANQVPNDLPPAILDNIK